MPPPAKWRASLPSSTNRGSMLKRRSSDHLSTLDSLRRTAANNLNLRFTSPIRGGTTSFRGRGSKRQRISKQLRLKLESSQLRVFDWPEYLKINNTTAIPSAYFINVPFAAELAAQKANSDFSKITPPNFRINQYLEGIDPFREGCFCALSVAELTGRRVRLHFCGFDDKYDFWTSVDSPLLFPIGWCKANNRRLEPPKPAPGDSQVTATDFDWAQYIAKQQTISSIVRSGVPVEAFTTPWQCPYNPTSQPNHMFSINCKLEATDKRNPALTCVATVTDFIRDYVLITFDGWDPRYDQWLHVSSELLHPVGFCQENEHPLSVPRDWTNRLDEFTWERYLKDTNSKPVPMEAFSKEYATSNLTSKLKVGQCFELVDRRCPQLIRVASIASIGHNGLMEVSYKGWDAKLNTFIEAGSLDAFPVGYCRATGHPLQPPPECDPSLHSFNSLTSFGGIDCATPGCKGIGHVKGPRHLSHQRLSGCPYADTNLRRDYVGAHGRLGYQASVGARSPSPSESSLTSSSITRRSGSAGEPPSTNRLSQPSPLPLDLTTTATAHASDALGRPLTGVTGSNRILSATDLSALSMAPTASIKSSSPSKPIASIATKQYRPRGGIVAGAALGLRALASLAHRRRGNSNTPNSTTNVAVTTLGFTSGRRRGRPRKFASSLHGLPSSKRPPVSKAFPSSSVSEPLVYAIKPAPPTLSPPAVSMNGTPPHHTTNGDIKIDETSKSQLSTTLSSGLNTTLPMTSSSVGDGGKSPPSLFNGGSPMPHDTGRSHLPVASVIPNPSVIPYLTSSSSTLRERPFIPPAPLNRSINASHHQVTPDQLTSKMLPQVEFALQATHRAGLPGPHTWTVAMVGQFIEQLPGCKQFAVKFIENEIDGAALLYIEQSDLLQTLKLKLGPAVKIAGAIQVLRRSVLSAPDQQIVQTTTASTAPATSVINNIDFSQVNVFSVFNGNFSDSKPLDQ